MKTWIVGAVGIVALLVAITAMRSEPSSAAAGTLTTADYVEIRQLYNRYNHHIDNAKDDGYAYARLFTEDGVSKPTSLSEPVRATTNSPHLRDKSARRRK